jgi:hypothetical protein
MEATLMHKIGKAMLIGTLALVFSIPAANTVSAQGPEGGRAPIPIANGEHVYFAGFISETPVPNEVKIVGAVGEYYKYLYGRGDRVFMNKGQGQGVQVGEVYQILRPLGAFYHPFKNAKVRFPSFERRGDQLGYFTDEIGVARVISVQDKTATLEISESFIEVRIGDVLIPFQKREMPEQKVVTPIDPLAPSNGKTNGQIIFARAQREQLGTSDVVFIDLGQKAGVKVGDYFTIFREQGSENINHFRDDEVALKHNEISSDRFRGGNYSQIHPHVQKEKIDLLYPGKDFPRTVVGELVVTRVEGNTATCIITRVLNGEVFLGDKIELQ